MFTNKHTPTPTPTHTLPSEHVHPNFQVCEDQQQTAAPTGSLDHPNFMAAEVGHQPGRQFSGNPLLTVYRRSIFWQEADRGRECDW